MRMLMVTLAAALEYDAKGVQKTMVALQKALAITHASASQRSEALLRTIGKWVES